MPGLVPGIHVLRVVWQGVDGRDKPGHDDAEASVLQNEIACLAHDSGKLSIHMLTQA
jgi:hypothetical protein